MSKRRTPTTTNKPAKKTEKPDTTTPPFTPDMPTPPVNHLDLAADALADGWTREQVMRALIVRVHRDTSYLAYRKASNRRTGYDAQVQQDRLALSLAAFWLAEDEISGAQLK